MTARTHAPIAAALGLALAAASTSSAAVRVIHASPDAPNVDVYVNTMPGMGDPAITNLAYTAGTDYIGLPTGDYNFQVTPTGETNPVVIDLDAMLDENDDVTVVAGGFLSGIAPYVYADDDTSDPDNARVRFIHQSPDAPTVDVFAAGVGDPLFDAVSFSESGGYATVAPGSYDLEVRLDDGGGLALAVPGVSVLPGYTYTIFAMGSVGDGSLEAVVFVDAIPGPAGVALLGLAGLAGARRRRA